MTPPSMPRPRLAQHPSHSSHSNYRSWPVHIPVARGWVRDALNTISPMWPLVLSITLWLVGGTPQSAYSGTDVFRSSGGKWEVSFGGTGSWQQINTSSIGVPELAFGDFNGDCRTDVFRSSGGRWQVSFKGTEPWQTINTSSIGLSQLRFGDFDGDGKTDVFRSSGGRWQVSFAGTGPWQIINTSSIGVADLGFGDFDGDGKTDVFRSSGGKWQVSFAGTAPWQTINTSSIGLSALRFGNFNGPATAGENTTAVCLRVARYTTATLSDANADTILQAASNVLQTDDDGAGPNDVACLMQFTRQGRVTAFDDGDGSIDSAADFNAVIALPGVVKVVNQINWCSAIGFNIIGCAPTPGSSLVVVRFTANQEGILWAHEYGHTRGLPHNTATTAIMNPTIATTRTMVTPSECATFAK
jgi:hypothetical protein